MTNSHTFYSVSAPAGSGKTYAAIGYAIDLAKNHQKVIIAQPTKALIDQTEADLIARNSGVQVTKIVSVTGRRVPTKVVARILSHMNTMDLGKGEVLLISQQALNRLPDAFRQLWHLIVDEVPGAFKPHDMNISKSHGFITSHLTLGGQLIDNYREVVPADIAAESALTRLAENGTRDTALALFKDLVEDILNEDKIVCVDEADYAEIISNKGKRQTINFFAFQRSEFVKGFASVTMMGANFSETELFGIWEKLDNIEWKPHPIIGQKLRYQTHTNGSRLTIKYVIKGNWSQYFANLPHGNDTILDGVCKAMEAELGDQFLWQANKKYGSFLFDEGTMLPQTTHGLNHKKYESKHGVALIKAINHSSGPAKFLKVIGFTAEQLKITLQYQNEYQAMMRCSLRNPKATDPVTVCVASEGSAQWIAKHFPGCAIEQMDTTIPEPKPSGQPAEKVRSSTERSWDRREKQKAADALIRGDQ